MRRLAAILRRILHGGGGDLVDGSAGEKGKCLVENGDGTVTDVETTLMWQAQSDGVERTHEEAADYCRQLALGGYCDWRLPSVSEIDELKGALVSLAEEERPIKFDWPDTWTASHGSEYGYAGEVFMISDHTTMFPQSHFQVLAVRSSEDD